MFKYINSHGFSSYFIISDSLQLAAIDYSSQDQDSKNSKPPVNLGS